MMSFLTFLFSPNPGHLAYGSAQAVTLLCVSAGLILASFLIRYWRVRLVNAVTKKLSRSWSSTAFWFGCIGLVLIVSRIEKIQFLAMRFFWVLWVVLLILVIVIQGRVFRMRHYAVLPRVSRPDDPSAKYLPGKRK